MLAACGIESVGRPLSDERRFRLHLPILRDGRNQQTRAEVPRAHPVQRHRQVEPVRQILLRTASAVQGQREGVPDEAAGQEGRGGARGQEQGLQ